MITICKGCLDNQHTEGRPYNYGTQRCSRSGTNSRLINLCVPGSSPIRAASDPPSQLSRMALLRVPFPLSGSPALQVPHAEAAITCLCIRSISNPGAAIGSTALASHDASILTIRSAVFVMSASGGKTGLMLIN